MTKLSEMIQKLKCLIGWHEIESRVFMDDFMMIDVCETKCKHCKYYKWRW